MGRLAFSKRPGCSSGNGSQREVRGSGQDQDLLHIRFVQKMGGLDKVVGVEWGEAGGC